MSGGPKNKKVVTFSLNLTLSFGAANSSLPEAVNSL